MKFVKLLAYVALLALWAAPASAACAITLRNVSNVLFTSAQAYPIFNTGDTGQSVSFQVRHPNGQAACNYFVTLTKGGASTYTGRRFSASPLFSYQAYLSSSLTSILKDVPDAVAGEVITGTFSSTALVTNNHTYYVNIPAQQVIPAGTYTDTSVTLKLYEGTLASYTQRDTATITMRAETVDTTQLCVGCVTAFDTNAHALEMNFGTLETGEYKTGTLRVRSNEGYTLALQSSNRSVLKHTTTPTSTVPYTATVNGVGVTLTGTSAVTVATVSGVTLATGTAYDVTITIGTVAAAALPGNYTDFITVTVTGM